MGWLVTKNVVFRAPPGDLVQSFIDSGLMVKMHDDILTVDTEVHCWRPVWWWTATSYSLAMSLMLLKRTMESWRCLFRFRSVLPESTKLQIIQSMWVTSYVYKTVLKCIFMISNNKSLKKSVSPELIQIILKRQNLCSVFNLRWLNPTCVHRMAEYFLPKEVMCSTLKCCLLYET